MMNYKHIICAFSAVCFLYGCADWDEHYVDSEVEGANATLWQQL